MSVRKAAMWAAAAQYVGFTLQFVSSVIIARYFLDPAEVGVFTVAFSAAAIITGLQDFGLNRFIVGATEMSDALIRKTITVSMVVGFGICVVVISLARPVADFYDNEQLFLITAVIGASFVFIPFSVVPQALMQRDMDFKSYALVEIAANTVNVTITIAAAWAGYSSLSLAFGVFGYQASRAIFSQFARPMFRILPPSWEGTGPIFKYGLSSATMSLTSGIATRAPDLIIGKTISDAALGLYSRASGLALQFRMLVGGPIASVLYPSLARARDRGEPLGDRYLRLTAALCAVTWAAMAGLAAASEPLILALYGEKWIGAAPVLVWVSLAQIFFIAIPMQIEVGYMLGRWRRVFQLTLLDVAISIALLIVAVPYGLIAVAVSRAVHGLIWWCINAVFVKRMIGFAWRDLLTIYFKTALAAVAAVIPLLANYLFWLPPSRTPFLLLALLAGIGVALWFLMLRVSKHPSADDLADIVAEQLAKLRAIRTQANGEGTGGVGN